MSVRLVAEHFGPTGTPKRPFPTVDAAAEFRRNTPGTKSKRIYECSVCGSFHLGRRPRDNGSEATP